ncbi:unnamed protein product [Toxocara canis]|uniref:39S ribosomal protein L37, mitochondrial n=1 Tax=Toxocara canis TaxID=6265 RepID=A0A183TZN2_TOXCA|nr:unnamed protein product [Toxocara canis]
MPVCMGKEVKNLCFKDHPLYKAVKCALFDGTEPFTDGIDQACALTNAVRRPHFPPSVTEKASKIKLPNNFEDRLCDMIMHGERYDPTLEKLPKRHDPVLFWLKQPRLYGTPVLKRNNIILDNLYRSVLLMAVQHDQLEFLRFDRDEPLSGALNFGDEFEDHPFVVRSQPHLIVQSPMAIQPWANEEEVKKTQQEKVPDVTPIDPRIDLTEDNIYNVEAVVPRSRFRLHLDTIFWGREQDQKYPWTREQNAANAVMHCFGAALVEATRMGKPSSAVLPTPVTTRAVQLVDGRLDLVVFQLNSLDLTAKSPVKNIVWVEPALQLYKPGPFYENYDAVVDLDVKPYMMLMGLLLTR